MSYRSDNHILVISDDVVDTNMGGVGVRNWELSHSLASQCVVTLAVPNQTGLSSPLFKIIPYRRDGQDLISIAESADAIIIQGFVLHFQPYLAQLQRPLAVDLYVPSLLESLVWHDRSDWGSWIPQYEEYLRVQTELLRSGDFFFCASERQRDYWLGWLHSQKRINPHTYHHSPDLRKLIEVVPFGIPREAIQPGQPVLKGIIPGILPADKLVIWSGGLWDWLDPLSLIRAVGQLVPQHPEIKLFFMGTSHPNPVVSGMRMAEYALELSRELGLLNKHIFFGDWIPYLERGRYLAEADLAVISHPDHIETHFSFRTRVLDCIWAGLPLISTQGDTLSEMVASHNVGLVVPSGDDTAMAGAIEKLLEAKGKPEYVEAFDQLKHRLQWDTVAQPLIEFCLNPSVAPDKGQYLTEIERVSRDKDDFLQRVIEDKDTFLAQVVHDKDAYFEQVIHEKDAATQQAQQEQASYFQEIIGEKEDTILKQQQVIEKYQKSLPMRLYFGIKHLINR